MGDLHHNIQTITSNFKFQIAFSRLCKIYLVNTTKKKHLIKALDTVALDQSSHPTRLTPRRTGVGACVGGSGARAGGVK